MTINFYLDRPNEVKSPIIIYYHDSIRCKYSTGITIPVNEWNNKKQRVKQRSGWSFVNQRIDEFDDTAREYYKHRIMAKIRPSKIEFKNWMKGKTFNLQPRADAIDFFEYSRAFIEQSKKSKSRSKGRHKALSSVINVIESFQKEWHKDVSFGTMDMSFFADFSEWQLNRSGTARLSTIFSAIRLILSKAKGDGHFVSEDYSQFRVKIHPTDRVFLTMEELFIADEVILSESQIKTYHSFLIGALTGLRYGDYSLVSKTNIVYDKNKPYLRKRAEKVNKIIYIPLHPMVLKILDLYNGPPKKITNQIFNAQIKKIYEKSKLDYDVIVSKDVKGEMVDLVGPKYSFISSHTARTSFITNLLIVGVPDAIVMDLAGITQYDTLKRYQRLKPKHTAELAYNYKFFEEINPNLTIEGQ